MRPAITPYLVRLARPLAGAGLCAVVACGAPSSGDDVQRSGWYRAAVIASTGEQIPFFLQVPDNCATATATIVNGEEWIQTACQLDERGLSLRFPVYGTAIDASFETGGLSGSWDRELPSGRVRAMRFEARPASTPNPENRFPDELAGASTGAERSNLSGTWRFDLDSLGVARGTLGQAPSGVVRGTIESPTEYGDLRFLAGNLTGQNLYLSTFDGQNAVLLTAQVIGPDTLQGEIVFGDESREWFVARRDDDFALGDPLTRMSVTSSDGRVGLEPLLRAPYVGQPVIVEIFGTWCPNCNDLASTLADLYRNYHDDDLEILAIAYEISSDRAYNERRVQAYSANHDVEWEIVLSDTTAAELSLNGPSGLSTVRGVPVTIFINRDGTVQGVYTGFSGPATGEAHRQAVAAFGRLTNEILASN